MSFRPCSKRVIYDFDKATITEALDQADSAVATKATHPGIHFVTGRNRRVIVAYREEPHRSGGSATAKIAATGPRRQ